MSAWQPIETAPTNKQILICCGEYGHYIPVVAYRPEPLCPDYKGGWRLAWHKELMEGAWPTHWMELPEKPNDLRKKVTL